MSETRHQEASQREHRDSRTLGITAVRVGEKDPLPWSFRCLFSLCATVGILGAGGREEKKETEENSRMSPTPTFSET